MPRRDNHAGAACVARRAWLLLRELAVRWRWRWTPRKRHLERVLCASGSGSGADSLALQKRTSPIPSLYRSIMSAWKAHCTKLAEQEQQAAAAAAGAGKR